MAACLLQRTILDRGALFHGRPRARRAWRSAAETSVRRNGFGHPAHTTEPPLPTHHAKRVKSRRARLPRLVLLLEVAAIRAIASATSKRWRAAASGRYSGVDPAPIVSDSG